MKLSFEWFDGRSFSDREVRDMDLNNRVVGFIASGRQSPGIHISLFDGRYTTTVSCFEECRGFVEGVEKVLDHMTSIAGESTSNAVKRQYQVDDRATTARSN